MDWKNASVTLLLLPLLLPQ
jgi:hypothetical protein